MPGRGNYWSVGDTKDVTLTGNWQDLIMSNVTVKAFIIGFDHNSAVEESTASTSLWAKSEPRWWPSATTCTTARPAARTSP